MTVKTTKNIVTTIRLSEVEKNAIETVQELFSRLAEIVSEEYQDDCDIWDMDNDVPINVPSDELNTIATHLEEFFSTYNIKFN